MKENETRIKLFLKQLEMKIILNSKITCPHCGFSKEETMPEDSCQYFYRCEKCKIVLKPRKGDCCVFCSYGTIKCPSIQVKESG